MAGIWFRNGPAVAKKGLATGILTHALLTWSVSGLTRQCKVRGAQMAQVTCGQQKTLNWQPSPNEVIVVQRLRGGSAAGVSERVPAADEDWTDENVRKHLNDSHYEYEAGVGGPGFRSKLPGVSICVCQCAWLSNGTRLCAKFTWFAEGLEPEVYVKLMN